MSKVILPDGSVQGETFSGPKYTGGYPSPKSNETPEDYHKRVKALKEQGFHLGDLSDGDWGIYCRGSGTWRD